MKTCKPGIIAASVFIFLAGCGGGGSDSQPPLEGAFTGSFSNGVHLTNLILADGSFWSAYQTSSGAIEGFSKGKVVSDNGKFTVTFTDFPKPGNSPVPGNGSGVYTSSSAAGSITEGGQTLTFDTKAVPAKNYIYKTPASITSIVGSWSGGLLDGDEASVEISADGIFSGVESNDCEYYGKFTPTDINVFNVSLTFGGEPCALPDQTVSGIGLTALRDDGKNQLLVALVNPAHTLGSLFVATR